jgi:NTE family protein
VFALLWLAVCSAASAQDAPATISQASSPAAATQLQPPSGRRPRIGLVLSGGGARGAAHIGVLKVLEQLHVPVDAIAGTSMGAVVGGLYASGLSADEIESIVTSLDWQDAFRDWPAREDQTFRRKQEDENFLVKFPLGIRGSRIQLPKGLIQGQKLSQTLRRLTLPVSGITRFDDLPIRFRAVATDLETGDAVVMDSGDLTSAMRASLSAPGVFAPVQREGRLLVDGGISENVPVDVARQMGVDIVIVVDVGFPLLPREKLTSAPVISNQMLAILIQRNSHKQLATLSSKDILVEPQLGDISSFDFGIFDRIISAGVAAGRASTGALESLAITPEEYQQYLARHLAVRSPAPRIDFVKIEAGSEHYAHMLERRFGNVVGKPLDPDLVAQDVSAIYGQGNLEMLDYRVVRDDDSYGVALSARRNSWGPNYVRFGLSLQDDFQGNATYNAAARLVLSEITEPGGEWVWDMQIGNDSKLYTEVYLPLSGGSNYFFLPHVLAEVRNIQVLDDQVALAQYRLRTFNYGLDFGREFGNWGELRTGVQHERGRAGVNIGDPTLPEQTFDTRTFFLRASYDTLDNVNFPRRGHHASFEWDAERTSLGSDQKSDRLQFDYLYAHSFGRTTTAFSAAGGTTLNTPNVPQIVPGGIPTDLRLLFQLGGFLNLSGLRADSISGPHFGLARAMVYKQIGRGGPGYLDVPTYLGMSLEIGNVWNTRSEASLSNTHRDASVFLGMDTFIGPIYVATGFDNQGHQSFYLFLGRTF